MTEKRVVNAKQLMRDIRDGMPASAIMSKYQISPHSLRKAFRKLIDFEIASKAELGALANLHATTADGKSMRRIPRKPINFPLQIFQNDDPFHPGLVKDVSRKGVCIEGMDFGVTDEKSFIIRTGSLSEHITVIFDAKCRWVHKEGRKTRAGFEITSISVLDSEMLSKLMAEA
jgi:hypothetical protein